jgi:hypothetical protein
MNEVRRRALSEVAFAVIVMAGVFGYLLGVDYRGWAFPKWAGPLTVAFTAPFFVTLIRSGYALVMGRRGSYPFGPLT